MQRRIGIGITVVLLAIGLTSLPAQNRSAVADALEDQGYQIIEEYTDGGAPSWRLRDDQDRRFSVTVIGSFSSTHATALEAMNEVIFEIDGLEIDRLRYVFDQDRADAVVIPDTFTVDGDDYVQYLQSGMQFEFDDADRFDFRLLVDNLAVRINGQFVSEEQFLDRLQRAVENPANYIQSQDPQFLAQQLVNLRGRMEERVTVDAEQDVRDQEILSRVERLDQEGEARLDELTRRGEQAVTRIEDLIAEVAEQQTALLTELAADFEGQLEVLREEKAALESEFESLRRGAIILASRNLFGSLREVAPESILQAVELRAADPELTADEVQEQVNGSLPEDAEPLHNKHIQAIFALYFNQYE